MMFAHATIASLLLRLGMVAGTMAVVCWIGWKIPEAQKIQALHAQGLMEAEQKQMIAQARRPVKAPPSAAMAVGIDVNRATEHDLERLPGIGPVLAQRIVEYRETRGSFQELEQLRRVRGIGEKTFARIRGLLVVAPGTGKRAGKAA